MSSSDDIGGVKGSIPILRVESGLRYVESSPRNSEEFDVPEKWKKKLRVVVVRFFSRKNTRNHQICTHNEYRRIDVDCYGMKMVQIS